MRAAVGDGVDRRASHEREQADHPDQARRRGQREQVVPSEKRLQDHVVERERERRPEDDQRALRSVERQRLARPERNHDRHAGERDGEPEHVSCPNAVEAEGEREAPASMPGDSATTSAAIPEVVWRVPTFRNTW